MPAFAPACPPVSSAAGLAVSLQWQLDTPAVPAYDPLKPRPSINEGDVANYILAIYGSVAELQVGTLLQQLTGLVASAVL